MLDRWIFQARLPDSRDIPTNEVVHDGDSVWMELDRGLDGTGTPVSIRLKDVRAPEVGQTGSGPCKLWMESWLTGSFFPPRDKWPFTVETFKTKGDRTIKSFERYIGVIWIGSQESATLNKFMIDFIKRNGFPLGK